MRERHYPRRPYDQWTEGGQVFKRDGMVIRSTSFEPGDLRSVPDLARERSTAVEAVSYMFGDLTVQEEENARRWGPWAAVLTVSGLVALMVLYVVSL